EHDLHLGDTPDLLAPLAAAALFATHHTRLRGAEHTRVKESDRPAVLAAELRKLGARVEERPAGLEIEPLAVIPAGPIQLDRSEDPRVAMAFGVVSMRVPGIRVLSPGCVDKSFPEFWQALEAIRCAREAVDWIEAGSRDARRMPFGPALVGLRG